jgi:hypothetical protein
MKVVEMAELPRLIAYRSAVVVAPICRPDGHYWAPLYGLDASASRLG